MADDFPSVFAGIVWFEIFLCFILFLIFLRKASRCHNTTGCHGCGVTGVRGIGGISRGNGVSLRSMFEEVQRVVQSMGYIQHPNIVHLIGRLILFHSSLWESFKTFFQFESVSSSYLMALGQMSNSISSPQSLSRSKIDVRFPECFKDNLCEERVHGDRHHTSKFDDVETIRNGTYIWFWRERTPSQLL